MITRPRSAGSSRCWSTTWDLREVAWPAVVSVVAVVTWLRPPCDQCQALEKAFQAATKQRVRDTFTKAQRKNLETWTTTALDIINHFR